MNKETRELMARLKKAVDKVNKKESKRKPAPKDVKGLRGGRAVKLYQTTGQREHFMSCHLGDTGNKTLDRIHDLLLKSLHMDVSNSVLIPRALEVYLSQLILMVTKSMERKDQLAVMEELFENLELERLALYEVAGRTPAK